MSELTLTMDKMVHGGKAMGRVRKGKGREYRPIFVPNVLPGEQVRVHMPTGQGRSADAQLIDVLKPSPHRVPRRCTHISGDCDFQHIAYKEQLALKTAIVADQFQRIARINPPPVAPMRPHSQPFGYRLQTTLSATKDDGVGYWSRATRRVERVDDCHRLHPVLRHLLKDMELALPNLRSLTLRVGGDDAPMLVFAMQQAEPPELAFDAAVSAALVMPDGVAATLIGEPFLTYEVLDRPFQVSAGSFFHSSEAGAAQLTYTVAKLAALTGSERVVEWFSGVGMLTSFLADGAAEVIGIEKNGDAVECAATNLHAYENVALYNAWVEDVMPTLEGPVDLLVLDVDDEGVSAEAGDLLTRTRPNRVIYSSGNLTTAAQDAYALAQAGYRLLTVQPIDMEPNTHLVHTVGLWERGKS